MAVEEKIKGHEAQILDIGTGSGAIAVALAVRNHNAVVWASDFSQRALEVAKKNAVKNRVDINFVHSDALGDWSELEQAEQFDVIVSNPPYIPASELTAMHKNVVNSFMNNNN